MVGFQDVEHFIFAVEAMCMGNLGNIPIKLCMASLYLQVVFGLAKPFMRILAYCFQKSIAPGCFVENGERFVDQGGEKVKNFTLFELRSGGFRHYPVPEGRIRL